MIEIRAAVAEDAEALALLGAATMLETYAERIAGTDIVAHCERRHSASFYEAWLKDPGITIWIAETRTGAAVGYLVLMPAALPVDEADPRDLEVQRIYVLSRFHASGVGYRLMAVAIEAAQARSARRLVLGVMKANERAVAFYRRQGFEPIGSRQFQVGNAVFDDYVMGRMLDGG